MKITPTPKEITLYPGDLGGQGHGNIKVTPDSVRLDITFEGRLSCCTDLRAFLDELRKAVLSVAGSFR